MFPGRWIWWYTIWSSPHENVFRTSEAWILGGLFFIAGARIQPQINVSKHKKLQLYILVVEKIGTLETKIFVLKLIEHKKKIDYRIDFPSSGKRTSLSQFQVNRYMICHIHALASSQVDRQFPADQM